MPKTKSKPKSTVILNKKNGKPFVTKVGKKYFIEKVEYTDDINLLLDAIANVKSVQYNDLFSPNLKTKEDYWKTHFNHQWGNGGLILWQNQSEMWRQEMTRRGQEFCPTCNTKMKMYYTPYCPNCEELKKDEHGRYNFIKMETKVYLKYKITSHRDYAVDKFKLSKSSTTLNCERQRAWELKNYPILATFRDNPEDAFNETGMKFYNSPEGKEFFNNMNKTWESAPDGKKLNYPYLDFWHTMLRYLEHRNWKGNDCSVIINWKDFYDGYCHKEWEKEIGILFVKEYGNKDYNVLISW
jgi:hypothetical protein